jgi:hypothetical protein
VDQVAVIVAALAAGAAAGVKDAASSAVKDAYDSLKALVRSRFGRHGRSADGDLATLEAAPGSDAGPLVEQLRSIGAGADDELVTAARALLEQADPDGAWQRRYSIVISNSKGVVGHNEGTVTMNFADGD